jgi:hypothetical protein
MTAKEKAEELNRTFGYAIRTEETGDGYFTNVIHANICAIIHVNGIIEEYTHRGTSQIWEHPRLEYWNEVKLELEKL